MFPFKPVAPGRSSSCPPVVQRSAWIERPGLNPVASEALAVEESIQVTSLWGGRNTGPLPTASPPLSLSPSFKVPPSNDFPVPRSVRV